MPRKPTVSPERIKTAREFLEAFYNEGDRVSVICNFDTETEGKPEQKKGKIKTLVERLPVYLETATAISLNLMDGKGSKADNVAFLNLCWTELDGLSLRKLDTPYPHRVYSRDETHFYLFWKLKQCEATEENVALHRAINEKLVSLYEGDPQSKDVARRLRIPGSFHPSGKFYEFQEDLSRPNLPEYNLEDLAKELKVKPPEKGRSSHGAPRSAPEQVSEAQLLAEVREMLYRAFPETVKGDGRSGKLFLLGIDCHDWGVPLADALQLAFDVNQTKCKPPESESVLRHQIESAYKYARNDFGELLRDYEQAKDRKRAQQKFLDEQKVRECLESYVFVAGYERLVGLQNWLEFTTVSQIENYIAYLTGKAIGLKTILRRGLVHVVQDLDFFPGEERFIRKNGKDILNRFCNLEIQPLRKKHLDSKAVKTFLAHLEYLTTSEIEYQTLLNYIAWQIQNPGKKTMFATLIISHSTGIGKSLLERFFRHVFKAETGQNYVTTIENHQLTSPYTDYMKDRLVGFVHELGEYDRFNLMFRLKDLITGEFLAINEKYARPFQVRNTVNFFFFSNLKNAIRLDEQDRRLFVIYNEKPPMPREYYANLVSCIDEGFQSIYTYLLNLDISEFSPFERPAMTAGKKQLIDLGKSELAIYLEDQKDREGGPFERGFFTLQDVVNHVEAFGPASLRNRVSQKAVSIWLAESGFQSTRKQSGEIRKTWWHSTDVALPDDPDEAIRKTREESEVEENF